MCKAGRYYYRTLQIQVSDTNYTVPMVYLVDQVEQGVCVLRMRPLDPESDNHCSTVCGMPNTCTYASVILGLPFLHRYCVSYDPAAGRVGLSNLLEADGDEGGYSNGNRAYDASSAVSIGPEYRVEWQQASWVG